MISSCSVPLLLGKWIFLFVVGLFTSIFLSKDVNALNNPYVLNYYSYICSVCCITDSLLSSLS